MANKLGPALQVGENLVWDRTSSAAPTSTQAQSQGCDPESSSDNQNVVHDDGSYV